MVGNHQCNRPARARITVRPAGGDGDEHVYAGGVRYSHSEPVRDCWLGSHQIAFSLQGEKATVVHTIMGSKNKGHEMKTTTKQCKHGTFTYYDADTYVGKSLNLYGEFSEDEVEIFRKCLLPTDLAIEVGSNIGALTVPMSRFCEQVLAFEPVDENYQLLLQNLIQNGCENVHPYKSAVGSSNSQIAMQAPDELKFTNFGAYEVGHGSRLVPILTIDGAIEKLKVERKIKFIKIDVEGHELEVLKGAEKLLARDMPILYVENDRQEKSAELVGWLIDHGYLCYLHQPPLFNRLNHSGNKKNVFGEIVSINMLCAHENSRIEIENLDRINDHR